MQASWYVSNRRLAAQLGESVLVHTGVLLFAMLRIRVGV